MTLRPLRTTGTGDTLHVWSTRPRLLPNQSVVPTSRLPLILPKMPFIESSLGGLSEHLRQDTVDTFRFDQYESNHGLV